MLDVITQRARRIGHSVKIDHSEISEKFNALRYALCALRL
jgi:hypothetical protein